MRFKINHGLQVGQIIRDGRHFREVVFTLGPLYSTIHYRVNGPLMDPKHKSVYRNQELLDIVNETPEAPYW